MARSNRSRTTRPKGPAICSPRQLPTGLRETAAQMAVKLNAANAPRTDQLDYRPSPDHLALLTSKYWGVEGVDLTVSFMGSVGKELQARILSHMNAWAEFCSVRFVPTSGVGKVRISLGGDGYWSYLGTDVNFIPENEPTLNLQGFSMSTSESEYLRVVRHEAGHTLGFPHEHMRRELVAKLDPQKTIAYFQRQYGWTAATTRAQVLTPLEEASILGTDVADATSIMTYQIAGQCTRDGKPIPGGSDIDADDRAFAARVYPLPTPPPPPADRIELAASGKWRASKDGTKVVLTLE